MRARTVMRLLLMGLAGTLALALVASVVALRGPAAVSRAADGDPAVVATVSVGDSPRGVAVNSTTNRIYVANWGSNNVSVVNGAANAVLGTPIPVGSAPEGVAANETTNRIYMANWGSNSVTVIDGATGATLDTIGVGGHP